MLATHRPTQHKHWSPLHFAARQGSDEVVGWLVACGARVNEPDAHRTAPLFYAAGGGHLETAARLLKSGADAGAKNRFGATPLHSAAQLGSPRMVHLLLSSPGCCPDAADVYGRTPLHYAAAKGADEVLGELIEADADLHALDTDQCTALHLAVANGRPASALILLHAGASTGPFAGRSPSLLHSAASRGCDQLVSILLGCGMSPLVADPKNQATPLHAAAVTDSVPVAHLFLSHGVPVNATDRAGKTALHYAALCSSLHYARCLVEQPGCLLDGADAEGKTALHYAVGRRQIGIVQLLVDAGADTAVVDAKGATPLDVAEARGSSDVANILLAASKRA
ncbi:Ankyrin repeat [Diplonema papillatum]|nr:Ankyrin repeat [Diplonema papillatum]|eukprot:gene23077-35359_t